MIRSLVVTNGTVVKAIGLAATGVAREAVVGWKDGVAFAIAGVRYKPACVAIGIDEGRKGADAVGVKNAAADARLAHYAATGAART